jgi:hypothetical protein
MKIKTTSRVCHTFNGGIVVVRTKRVVYKLSVVFSEMFSNLHTISSSKMFWMGKQKQPTEIFVFRSNKYSWFLRAKQQDTPMMMAKKEDNITTNIRIF